MRALLAVAFTLVGCHGGGAKPAAVTVNHRTSDALCAMAPLPGNCNAPGGGSDCAPDGDATCTSGTNGRCIQASTGAPLCRCTYDACMHDSDCGGGQLCVCHGSALTFGAGNTCLPGNCRVDADCGALACSPTPNPNGCGVVGGYYCHTADDDCTNDSDCAGSLAACVYDTDGKHWVCQAMMLCA